MRRKDREITDKNEIMDIIGRSKVIRIAFTGEGVSLCTAVQLRI